MCIRDRARGRPTPPRALSPVHTPQLPDPIDAERVAGVLDQRRVNIGHVQRVVRGGWLLRICRSLAVPWSGWRRGCTPTVFNTVVNDFPRAAESAAPDGTGPV